jgi:hypothetical protein
MISKKNILVIKKTVNKLCGMPIFDVEDGLIQPEDRIKPNYELVPPQISSLY